MNTSLSNKGFTLVELAVSLVVIGLLIGLGTAMVGPLMTAIKVRESKETIGGVVESVNSWASGNNTLPNAAGFSTTAKSPQDSWGRNFIYLFDANLYSATATKDTICGRKTTSLSFKTDPAATTTIGNIAYIVLSAGDDAAVQATLNNTIAPLPLISPPTLNGVTEKS